MDEWSDLEQALEQLIASGAVEVHEDGRWLAGLDGFRWEIRRRGRQALIHLWTTESNLVRQIVRISSSEAERVELKVHRFGRAKPGRLEFLRSDKPRTAARVSRERFREQFERMLEVQFPDAEVESLTTAADLKRSFSPLYTRGILTEGRASWAVIGVSPSESTAACEGILAFGLLWLDWARQHAVRRAVEGLRIFVPDGQARVTLERSHALRPEVGLEVFEFGGDDGRIHRADASGHGNVLGWLVARREVEATLAAASDSVESVRLLLAEEPRLIEASVPVNTREVSLRFRGLEFARWKEGRIDFGLGDDRRPLRDDRSRAELKKLVQRLSLERSSLVSDIKSPLYRAAPERWLESVVISDPTRIGAHLDPRYFYSQVPALAAGDRGVIDLLGVTLQGRLVVIELKASEDLQLPLQAVDYWLRVRRHLAEGEFQRYGYFPGVELRPDPPLIWLVAPSLRFHPAGEILLRYLSPELQIARIGLSESWRRGVQVVLRQQSDSR